MLDFDTCNAARLRRDPTYDGVFFTAVRTTGIYCRPVCPVKHPLTRNVSYYPSAAAAERAGYRPCLRCRPETAPFSPAWNGTRTTVERALRLIEEGALDTGTVEALAARLGVGARHLSRLFSAHLGASPKQVAQTLRMGRAKRLLDETALPITEVALKAGFGSVRRFNAAFLALYGRPPSSLRRGLGR
jgi:AraC family transcriptional regulator of adaptative response / DNA-3-methyladenine glycosylase II